MLQLLNLANCLSLFRLLVTPFIVYSFLGGYNKLAFFLFVLASLSDAADGIVARRLSQKSTLGAYLDAIADKALLVSMLTAFTVRDIVPSWFAIMIVIRECFIITAIIFAFFLSYRIKIRAILVSKVNTALLMILIIFSMHARIWELDADRYIDIMLYLITSLTIISAIIYFWIYSKSLVYHDSSSGNSDEQT